MGCCLSNNLVSKPGIRLSEIQSQLRPLDLIMFRGGDCVSDTISWAEKVRLGDGDWTHCGLVVTPDLFPIANAQAGRLYVWESTMSGSLSDGIPDVETGQADFGVQIRDLADVVDHYDNDPNTKIGWCQLLQNPLDPREGENDATFECQRVSQLRSLLSDFHQKHLRTTYNYNCLDLAGTLVPCLTKCSQETFGHDGKLFCSQLVCLIYQLVGLIPMDVDAIQVVPVELLGDANPNTRYQFPCPVKIPVVVVTRDWPQS